MARVKKRNDNPPRGGKPGALKNVMTAITEHERSVAAAGSLADWRYSHPREDVFLSWERNGLLPEGLTVAMLQDKEPIPEAECDKQLSVEADLDEPARQLSFGPFVFGSRSESRSTSSELQESLQVPEGPSADATASAAAAAAHGLPVNDIEVKITHAEGRKIGINFDELECGLVVRSVNPKGLAHEAGAAAATGLHLVSIAGGDKAFDCTDIRKNELQRLVTVLFAPGQTVRLSFRTPVQAEGTSSPSLAASMASRPPQHHPQKPSEDQPQGPPAAAKIPPSRGADSGNYGTPIAQRSAVHASPKGTQVGTPPSTWSVDEVCAWVAVQYKELGGDTIRDNDITGNTFLGIGEDEAEPYGTRPLIASGKKCRLPFIFTPCVAPIGNSQQTGSFSPRSPLPLCCS